MITRLCFVRISSGNKERCLPRKLFLYPLYFSHNSLQFIFSLIFHTIFANHCLVCLSIILFLFFKFFSHYFSKQHLKQLWDKFYHHQLYQTGSFRFYGRKLKCLWLTKQLWLNLKTPIDFRLKYSGLTEIQRMIQVPFHQADNNTSNLEHLTLWHFWGKFVPWIVWFGIFASAVSRICHLGLHI